MIKNQKQAKVTRDRHKKMLDERDQFIQESEGNIDSAKSRLTLNAYNGLIKDMELQLEQYNQLSKGIMNCIQKEFGDLPELLIAARLAQNISQKELANKLDVKEQQIQRYEANDYEGISYHRIKEVAMVLGLNCKFEKTWLMNTSNFDLPSGVSPTTADEITAAIKASGSILIQ